MTLKEIGKKMGVSGQWVRQMEGIAKRRGYEPVAEFTPA
jgi:DNA-directed RNA polymerase sigma subunit (sigma70/sigma32)